MPRKMPSRGLADQVTALVTEADVFDYQGHILTNQANERFGSLRRRSALAVML
jgi:hypothetical protein